MSIARSKQDILKETKLLHTQVIDVSYENTGTLTPRADASFSGLPDFYRVRLASRPSAGSEIFSEVWLPDDWNGIFLGLGNGGMAGNIHFEALVEYIKQGYAVANTDMGTSRGRDSGIDNPDVWKDFGWRATHLMTDAGKRLILAHYGKSQDYAYFIGASTGGQQALAEAQRFPEDYDGIIAGVPANNRTFLHTYFLWNYVHLRPRQDRPLFSHEEIQAVNRCAVEFFQKLGDGVKGDDFITFPRAGMDMVSGLVEWIAAENPQFLEAQLHALEKIYTGPVNPCTGDRIYNGMPAGSEIYGCGIEDCQQEESPHFYPFIWAFGKDYDGYQFDFDRDLDALNRKLAGDLNANNSDLSAFYQHGGKLLMYSGSADPCVPFPDAMKYYCRVMDTMGGYGRVSSFFRYFLFPGKEHGKGGRGTNDIWADMDGGGELDALRLWREHDKAPDALFAVGYTNGEPAQGIRFIRKVQPYGKEANSAPAECPPACAESYLLKQW